MSGEIAAHGNEDVPALSGVAPLRKLFHASLEHLMRVKARVLAQQGPPEGRDESLGRVSEEKMVRDQPGRGIDLVLAIKCVEQRGADRLRVDRQVVQRLTAVTGQPCRAGFPVTVLVGVAEPSDTKGGRV